MTEKPSPQALYDPKQVSEMLSIPPSTIRRYSRDWSDFLSKYASQGGKKRRYTDTDVLILRKIRQLTVSRRSQEEIAAAIQVVDSSPDESALALLPQISEAFENIHQRQAEHDAQIAELKQRLEQLEEEAKTPWYKRIFKRPD